MSGWTPFVAEVEGRFTAASNATLLGTTREGDRVIYKPVAGERPLWDFPDGTLAVREVLTCAVSNALGIGVVPETVAGDGIYGEGAVQRFIETNDAFDPLEMLRTDPEPLWPIAVLDVVVNNADRKLGHVLEDLDGNLIAIDHGLTFHEEAKLRTVLWVFAGRPVPSQLLAPLATLFDGGTLMDDVAAQLGRPSADALGDRVRSLLATGRHPEPPTDRPPVPWPPY